MLRRSPRLRLPLLSFPIGGALVRSTVVWLLIARLSFSTTSSSPGKYWACCVRGWWWKDIWKSNAPQSVAPRQRRIVVRLSGDLHHRSLAAARVINKHIVSRRSRVSHVTGIISPAMIIMTIAYMSKSQLDALIRPPLSWATLMYCTAFVDNLNGNVQLM